ncbi:MAG: ATP-binding protein [Candidatus Altiarchaeota archaeon]|nr:ATP-binding protein [Candidatus Altiarchaeota archaeon]
MEEFFKRKLEDEISRYIERREIIGIRGSRQTGKTTLLKIISDRIQEDKAFINLDLIEYRRTLEENPLDLVKRFKKTRKLFMFLDEVQRVKDGGEKLKIIYDEFPDVKLFISGSSSLELKTNILPSLVGRLFLYELYTFDFEEYLSVKDEGLARLFRENQSSLKKFLEGRDDIAPPSYTKEYMENWKDYVIYGGYPEVVRSRNKEEKTTILKNIYNLYLEKDITAFFKIEETLKFSDLLQYLAFNTSKMLSTSSLASDLKISHNKAEEYLTILQHTYIIRLLKPFHRNLVTELKKSPKIYFLDTGLRNTVMNNHTPFESRSDKGNLTENFVLKELTSNFREWKLNYWRTTGKAKIDFILRKDEEAIPVEVKLDGEKLGKGFYSFLKTYKPEKAVIATKEKFKKQKINSTTVYWIPAFYI